VRAFARIDNLLDRRYAGSVIVAQAQGRFLEPAPGRSVVIGLQVATGRP
jgi:iron complex outermembrane receptor protein